MPDMNYKVLTCEEGDTLKELIKVLNKIPKVVDVKTAQNTMSFFMGYANAVIDMRGKQ